MHAKLRSLCLENSDAPYTLRLNYFYLQTGARQRFYETRQYRRLGSDGIRGSEAEAKYLFSAQQTSRILWISTSTTHFSGCGTVIPQCLQKREIFTPKLWTSFHSSNAASRGVIRCTGFSVVSVPFRANCRKDSWIRWKNRIRLRWLYWRDSLCC